MIKKIIAFVLLLSLAGCAREAVTEESRLMMGTVVNMKIASDAQKDFLKDVIESSFSKMEEIESITNRFDEKSETALINKANPGEEITLSPQMSSVIKKSLELNSITEGAFDVTISPLAELWGFYGKEKPAVPSSGDIENVLARTGTDKITFNDKGTLRINRDGIDLDFSGIAKGCAVDEAVKVLKSKGINNALIDAGGDLYCLGEGPHKTGWRVGVRHPRERRFLGVLTLIDKAVATSGDYENYFFIDGKRYSHILDPRSGYPVSGGPLSVTIVAQDCMTADGLATAMSVLSTLEGLQLAEALDGVDAMLVSEINGELRVDTTSGLRDIYERF